MTRFRGAWSQSYDDGTMLLFLAQLKEFRYVGQLKM